PGRMEALGGHLRHERCSHRRWFHHRHSRPARVRPHERNQGSKSLSALLYKYDNVLFAVGSLPCYAVAGTAPICLEKVHTESSSRAKNGRNWSAAPINIRYHIIWSPTPR